MKLSKKVRKNKIPWSGFRATLKLSNCESGYESAPLRKQRTDSFLLTFRISSWTTFTETLICGSFEMSKMQSKNTFRGSIIKTYCLRNENGILVVICNSPVHFLSPFPAHGEDSNSLKLQSERHSENGQEVEVR